MNSQFPPSLPVYVMHVKTAIDRNMYINKELRSKNIPFEFVIEGDMPDLTEKDIKTYFKAEMGSVNPMSSCTFKHIKACERFLAGNHPVALMLEDDIELFSNFNQQVQNCLDELNSRGLTQCIVSLENSTLKRVSDKDRIPNQLLYKRFQGRCAGAYIIDRAGAKSLLEHARIEKCPFVIDWYHNLLSELNLLSIYWLEPPIAEQGSHNGKLKSLIDSKRTGYFKQVTFKLRKWLKGFN